MANEREKDLSLLRIAPQSDREARVNLRDFIIYRLPPLAWMVFIFPTNSALNTNSTSYLIVPVLKWLFPHSDQAEIDLLHIGVRKCFHFLNYAFLTFLLYRAFCRNERVGRPEWILYAGVIAVGYGVLDEFVQNFIPSRTGSVYDWLIDSMGVAFVLGIVFGKNRIWIRD